MIYDIVVSAQPVEEECIMRGYVRIVWSDSLVVSSSLVCAYLLFQRISEAFAQKTSSFPLLMRGGSLYSELLIADHDGNMTSLTRSQLAQGQLVHGYRQPSRILINLRFARV